MNKSFKVVFSKARSALMVVNEATSSIQAKGTKTVIAVAAAMVAGGAMAAATNYESVTINEGSSIVYTGATGNKHTTQILGTTATGVVSNATDKKPAAIADKTEVGTITTLAFSGGSVVVNASHGNAATVSLDAVNMGTSATQIAGNISVNAYQGAAQNASLTLQNIGLKSGTIDFGIVAQDATNDTTAAAQVKTGTATLSAGTVTLGATSDNVGNVGSQVVVKTVAGTDATITATGAGTSAAPSMNLVNVAVENAGKLTVSAATGDVVVGKDSTFVNTGVLTVTSAATSGKVDFAADYDGKTGILNISGANAVNITGNLTGDYVKVGGSIQVGTDGKVTPTTDKNTIGISGKTITIGEATDANGSVTKTGSLIVGNTLEIAGNFTNNTTVEAPATEVTAADGTVTNGQYGTMALGDLTIKADKGLTLANSNTSGAVTVGKLLLDGTLTVSSGDLEINGTGSKIGKGLLNIAENGVVTLKGDLTNDAGTTQKGIAFTGTKAKLTIAGSLDNTKNGVIGGDATSGSIVVTGTLTNKNTVGAKDITVSGKLSNLKNTAATEGYTGKITAGTVTVKEGGVVESALTAGDYAVTETVVNKGGTFITALNSNITAENDSLTLNGKFSLDGGVLGTAADTPVTKFNLISGDILTLNGDYTLDTVKEAGSAKFNVGTDATKTGNVTVKTLTAAGADSVVVNGTLAVTDSLTAATAGSVQVASGTLATSLKAMNLEANATTGDVAAITGKTQSAQAGFLTLSQDAVLDLDVGGTKVSRTGATTIVGLAGRPAGLIDLGAVELYKSASEAVKVTNGEIAATELAGFDNITTDTLKASRILGKDTIDKTSSYGAVELTKDAPTEAAALASAAGLTINDSVTLTLNGMGETAVNLVQYKNDKVAAVTFAGAASKLVTKGNGVIGEVKGGDTTKGVLEVADKGLTVEGNVVAKDVIVGTTGTLTMGTVADATKAYTVNVANLTVDGTFAAAQNTVTIGTSIEVDGTATIKTLDISAATNAAVEGTLTVDKLTATGKTMKVGRFDSATNKDAAGTVSVANFSTAGTIDATRAYTDKDAWTAPAASVAVKTAVAGALIKADENAYIAVGTTDTTAAQKALTAAGYTLAKTVDTDTTDKVEVNSIDARTVNTVVYVDGGKTATTNAVAFGGSIDTTDSTTSDGGEGVKIAANTALAFDTATIDTTGTTALFAQDLNIADGAVVAANNLKIGDKILLTAGNLTAVNYNWEDNVEFKGDILSHADVTDKVLSVAMYDKADLKKAYGLDSGVAGFDASYSYFANANRGAATTTSAQFAEWLYTKSSSAAYGAYSDGVKHVNVEAIRAIANAAGALGATTGVQTMTMDAVNQMGETVQDRVSVLTQRAAGVNVWAAANGGNFQAKTLYDGAGYKSDIYSGVLGVDYQFACNAVLGAALTVGTADTDSKNTAFGTSTDSDLVGFSVYTSKTFADIIGVSADIGYLSASNDVTANGYGFGYKFSEDTDAFTVGIRGEVLTQAGPVKIVPHIGLRYTALSTDSFEAAYVTDVDDQAIFQMPVGVTVSGDFQTGDWTVAPKFDLSVVPTFGDKDAEMKLGVTGGTVTSDYGVRVIDSNPVQATLGVNATNGAWGFGLNYKLGVGSDDRMNNTFNVNVRYAF